MRLAEEGLRLRDLILAMPGPIVTIALALPSALPKSAIWYLLPPTVFLCVFELLFVLAAIARGLVAYTPLARRHLLWLVSSGLPLIGVAMKFIFQ
jgi:hypothetical protein